MGTLFQMLDTVEEIDFEVVVEFILGLQIMPDMARQEENQAKRPRWFVPQQRGGDQISCPPQKMMRGEKNRP